MQLDGAVGGRVGPDPSLQYLHHHAARCRLATLTGVGKVVVVKVVGMVVMAVVVMAATAVAVAVTVVKVGGRCGEGQ